MDLVVKCPVVYRGIMMNSGEYEDVDCDGVLTVHDTTYFGPDRDVGLGPEIDWKSITSDGCNHISYELYNEFQQDTFMARLLDEYNRDD
jgi:hypothetical protein